MPKQSDVKKKEAKPLFEDVMLEEQIAFLKSGITPKKPQHRIPTAPKSVPSKSNSSAAKAPSFVKPVLVVWALAALLVFFASGYFLGFGSAESQFASASQPSQDSLQVLEGQRFQSSVNIVSVTSEGEGSLNQAEVEIMPGSGRVLFSINPFVEPDTQDSVRTAALVAEKFTGKSLSGKDIVVSVKNTPARLVGGPSAGAAITVAAIAAIQHKVVRSDAAITGTILPDGTIGQVSGIIEKATAAAEKGLDAFIVPKGQKILTYYERVQGQTQEGRFTIIRTRYVPRTVNVQDYLENEGYDIKIFEAQDVNGAVEYLLE